MNSLVLVAGAGFLFWLGYIIYADRIQKLFKPDAHRKTPAHTEYILRLEMDYYYQLRLFCWY